MTFIIENKNIIIVALGIIGLIMTLRTFRYNLQQRKIENTFKILDFMRNHIGEEQIEEFVAAFHANGELSGAAHDEFIYPDGRQEGLDYFFSEGGSGAGDIHNMIEIFNLVSVYLIKKEIKEDIIWYEYGQIMSKCHQWTNHLETRGPGHKYYNDSLNRSKNKKWLENIKLKKHLKQYIDPKLNFFYHFNRYMKKNKYRIIKNATKHYTYDK